MGSPRAQKPIRQIPAHRTAIPIAGKKSATAAATTNAMKQGRRNCQRCQRIDIQMGLLASNVECANRLAGEQVLRGRRRCAMLVHVCKVFNLLAPKQMLITRVGRLWGMKKKEKRIREEEDLNSSAAPTSREAHGPSSLRPNTLSRPPGKQHLSATQGLRTADSKDDSRTMKKHKGSGEIACADCGKCNPKRWRKGPNGPKTYCDACGRMLIAPKRRP